MFLSNQNIIGNPTDLNVFFFSFYDPFSDGRYQDKIILNEGDIELDKQILCTIIACCRVLN